MEITLPTNTTVLFAFVPFVFFVVKANPWDI